MNDIGRISPYYMFVNMGAGKDWYLVLAYSDKVVFPEIERTIPMSIDAFRKAFDVTNEIPFVPRGNHQVISGIMHDLERHGLDMVAISSLHVNAEYNTVSFSVATMPALKRPIDGEEDG